MTTLGAIIIILILQSRKLRHQRVKQLVQECTRTELRFELGPAAANHQTPLLPGRALVPYPRSGHTLRLKKWCHIMCIQMYFVGHLYLRKTALRAGTHHPGKTDSCSDKPGCLATYLKVTVDKTLLLTSHGLLMSQVG